MELKLCADHKKKELLVPGKGKSSASEKFLKNDYDSQCEKQRPFIFFLV